MNTRTLSAILFCCFFTSFFCQAQNFDKGTVVIDAGIKLAIFNTTSKDKKTGKTTTDNAGARVIPLSFEYGINQRIGVGGCLHFNNFITEEDSASKTTPTASSFDVVPTLSFHLLNRNRFDLFASLGFGFSAFNFQSNDGNGGQFKASGSNLEGKLEARIYFGKHLALVLNGAYLHYGYPTLKATDNSGTVTNDLSFKLSGESFGAGIALNF